MHGFFCNKTITKNLYYDEKHDQNEDTSKYNSLNKLLVLK